MASETVRVKGLRELQRGLKDYDKEAAKELGAELRAAGDVVRQEAEQRFASVNAESARGFTVRVRQRGVAVEQTKKRTTGKHPEFGARQMREALIPALGHRADEVTRALSDALDRARARARF